MDNSQSSNVFSGSADLSCASQIEMDIVSYDSLITNTKMGLCGLQNEIQKSTFSMYFNSLLEDCRTCVTHTLDLANKLLDAPNVQINKLIEYINNAACLLQMLSDFIKTVIESVSMSCCNMKTFPTTVGQIIMNVYTHCRDSESIYGNQLRSVEMQLKDLFRSCHELQLNYLMILERHFIFELSEKEEQDILLEALDINLKIGEIVQTLDVKTLAEQWKAYTMICEKHSIYLMDKNIHQDCTKALCMITRNNINVAMENDQEKTIVRSLKVASFTIKILLKICNIFKNASKKKYEYVVDLLLYLHVNSGSYLEMTAEKSTQFTSLINMNIANSSGCLLNELLLDEKFANTLFNYEVEKIKKEHVLLGYILLVVSVIKLILQRNDGQIFDSYKQKIIDCVYRFLPYCYPWFNMDLKFKTELDNQHQTYGLYEYLLAHTTGLAASMNIEQFNILETNMVEAILSTNCCSALFSSNLWVLLARTIVNHPLVLRQLISLNNIFLSLDYHELFPKSPQEVHLSCTINRLFESMLNEDKIKIYKQFSLHDDSNTSLWIGLKISNLPEEVQTNAEELVTEKLKMQFHKFANVDVNRKGIDRLIKMMNLAATCSFKTSTDAMEDLVINAWTKACLKNNIFLSQGLDKSSVWYYEYIEALAALTNSMAHHIFYDKSENLIKVLHVISNIFQTDITELKLVMMNLLFKLTTFDNCDDMVDSILTQIFTKLFQENDCIARNIFFNTLMRYKHNKKIDGMISNVVQKDYSLQESWSYHVNHHSTIIGRNEESLVAMDFKFSHKCLEERNIIELSDSVSMGEMKRNCSNFELADIDTLFDIESDREQPVCKKVRLNSNETDLIINRLENDVSMLCKMKENVFTAESKARIKSVCDALLNVIN